MAQPGVYGYSTSATQGSGDDAFEHVSSAPSIAFPPYSVGGQLPFYPPLPLYPAFSSGQQLSPGGQTDGGELAPSPTSAAWSPGHPMMPYSNATAYNTSAWDHLHAPIASSSNRFGVQPPHSDVPNAGEVYQPVTAAALQLEDMSSTWQASPRADHRPTGLTTGALGTGLGVSGQAGFNGLQESLGFAPTPSYQSPNTSILPPAKRRTSRPSSASSSEYQAASPYLHPAAPHCPPWLNMSPNTAQSLSLEQQQQQWRSGSYLPRSASLPHLPDYAQGYNTLPYAYPSPNPSPAYASLQNSPNLPAGLSLRGSPFTDSNSSISPRERALPFHSPASSITSKLALSKLSTWVAPSPAPTPKPPPITPDVDPSDITTTHAQTNRVKYGVVDGDGDSAGSPKSSSSRRQSENSLKQPRAVTSRKNMSEAEALCCTCHTPIGKVILRGTDQQRGVPWHSAMECFNCLSPDERGDEDGAPGAMDDGEVSRYENTFSAALDKLDGLQLEVVDTRPPPGKAKPIKKRKRSGLEREMVACELIRSLLSFSRPRLTSRNDHRRRLHARCRSRSARQIGRRQSGRLLRRAGMLSLR